MYGAGDYINTGVVSQRKPGFGYAPTPGLLAVDRARVIQRGLGYVTPGTVYQPQEADFGVEVACPTCPESRFPWEYVLVALIAGTMFAGLRGARRRR